MFIGKPEEYLEIKDNPQSKYLHISLKTHGLSGSTILNTDETNFNVFLKDLKKLESLRQGKAELIHFSDESEFSPFRLDMYSIDRLGHIALRTEINHIHYLQDQQPVKNMLLATLEIDVEKFASITKKFMRLAK